jgi:hypothetical protein
MLLEKPKWEDKLWQEVGRILESWGSALEQVVHSREHGKETLYSIKY